MDAYPTYFDHDVKSNETVVRLKKGKAERNSLALSSIFYISTSEVSKTTETKTYKVETKNSETKNEAYQDDSSWIKKLEAEAISASKLISKGVNNYDIVLRITTALKKENQLVEDLISAIKKHKMAMDNTLVMEMENSIKGPNISISSLFNALKFYPAISSLPQEKITHYIDADAHLVGMVIGDNSNKININFLTNGELSFRHIDKLTGRIRISGTAFFGGDDNFKDMKKIKKLLSFVKA